jgi:hypothetical protein
MGLVSVEGESVSWRYQLIFALFDIILVTHIDLICVGWVCGNGKLVRRCLPDMSTDS